MQKKALKGKFDTIRDSNRAFQLLNVLANYNEWEENWQGALDHYNKALQIPGVYQTRLSNVLVNWGFSLYRMKSHKESIIYIEKGVEMKEAIGDSDQLPIALHNLAQAYIEWAFTILDKAERTEYFLKAVQHAEKGLRIQNHTGSVKKKGQLLAEKFIAAFELTRLDQTIEADPSASLKAVQNWLRSENEAGRGASNDCKVVFNELLSHLDEFKGNTLEEAIAWQIPSKEE